MKMVVCTSISKFMSSQMHLTSIVFSSSCQFNCCEEWRKESKMCLCLHPMCYKHFYQTCMESIIIIFHIMPHVADMYMHSRIMNQQLLWGKESMIVDHSQQKCQLHNPHPGVYSVPWTLLHSHRLTRWFTYLETWGVITGVNKDTSQTT